MCDGAATTAPGEIQQPVTVWTVEVYGMVLEQLGFAG